MNRLHITSIGNWGFCFMFDRIHHPARDQNGPRVGIVSTFPPTRCGIARFSSALVSSLGDVAADIDVDLVRLIDGRPPTSALGQVGMEIDPNSPVSIRAAARHLDQCDVVILQHEYGIFGDNDGESVLELVDSINRPLITVVHTVVGSPSDRQRRIMDHLYETSRLVVLSESSRSALVSSHSIPRSEVVVIPHGSRWSPTPPPRGPARRLITWGLLGPGKGLERSIEAMATLRDLDPSPHYTIVGRTHPVVARNHGVTYRRRIESLVKDLGIEDMVDFVDHYLSDDELYEMVQDSHVVVVPYDNTDQVTSGVVTDAIAAGRPVIATRFPHAEELVGPASGIIVDHDSAALALGVRALAESPEIYDGAARSAAAKGSELSWTSGAVRYAEFIRSLVPDKLTISN
jgi:polysaccharide biosynthesis protein PslF